MPSPAGRFGSGQNHRPHLSIAVSRYSRGIETRWPQLLFGQVDSVDLSAVLVPQRYYASGFCGDLLSNSQSLRFIDEIQNQDCSSGFFWEVAHPLPLSIVPDTLAALALVNPNGLPVLRPKEFLCEAGPGSASSATPTLILRLLLRQAFFFVRHHGPRHGDKIGARDRHLRRCKSYEREG